MSDVFTTLATTLAKQGAPVIGGLIGTAIGGPVGAAVGGMAGKAIESLAEALGTAATPEAVLAGVSQPEAKAVVQEVEARAPDLMPLWAAQLAMAQQAQTAEIERGFNGWVMRRTVAHYIAWGLTLVSGGFAIYSAFMGHAGMTALAGLFSSSIGLTMAWMAVNSGGKALGDFAKEWKAK